MMKINRNNLNSIMESDSVEKTRQSIPESSSSLPSNSSADPYSFIAKVKSYLNNKIKVSNDIKSIGDCLFVLVPNDIKRNLENLGQEVNRFFSFTAINIKGKVILSLDTNLSRVRIIDTEYDKCNSDIDIQNMFSSEIDNILKLNPKTLCYARYENENSVLTSYPEGDENEGESSPIITKKVIYNCSDLEKHTNDFYSKELMYPSSTMMIWDSQKEFTLTKKAETRISVRLADSLQNKLGPENVISEGNVNSGRMDIYICPGAMTEEHGPCVIELKVLRNGNGVSHDRRWLYKGVLQARDYAADKNAKSKYLLSFDGREKCIKIDSIIKLANRYSVKYINYRLYNKTDQARDEEVEMLVGPIDD
ncbi:hypothetical protein [Citrobacter koseri]|uniref:hypothetical protein n=1 Tax=Citrobacter koseri TaxID=545 RepID=UPI0029439036|nr:hypothetical protein [Citrobacter koseri]MEB2702626.1 hypothetical protein [Citrobacter koseri]MEB2708228.1 hypothetical protein [Citrobacter koseri]MEB2770684.1 hypothetical protein [Citrobacter koseri]WOJ27995.1 hypothetical protein R1221_09270 [Citrobacter koseri]